MAVTHATVTISGDATQLEACEARLRLLLAGEVIDGACSDHHGSGRLCYDFKVHGGLPFPPFAQASLEFPALSFSAEWINAGAGERGAATIVNGQLTGLTAARLDHAIETGPPAYVNVAPDGRLELAFTGYRNSSDEWLGYCACSGRDALFRVICAADAVDFHATDGSAEWSLHARDGSAPLAPMSASVAIDKDAYAELEQLAQGFAAEWLWFANGREEDIAIEVDRYRRYGFTAYDANVRSARLHRMRQEAAADAQVLEFSTLRDEDIWVRDVVRRCWLRR